MNVKPSEAEILANAIQLVESNKVQQAIEILEEFINSKSQTSALLFLALADIYKNRSIIQVEENYSKAKENYSKAIQSTSTSINPEILIVAKAELADCLVREASAEFGNLKDKKPENQLKERLRELFPNKENQNKFFIQLRGCQECPPGSGKVGLPTRVGAQTVCFSC